MRLRCMAAGTFLTVLLLVPVGCFTSFNHNVNRLTRKTHDENLLAILDEVPSWRSGDYDPRKVIRAVNALQPLGKRKALRAIDEYLASNAQGSGYGGVFLVLRVLFEVPDEPGHMPKMQVGDFGAPAPSKGKLLSRSPIFLHDDIPFFIAGGFITMGGIPEDPHHHVAYFREHGKIRGNLLAPSTRPFRSLEKLLVPLSNEGVKSIQANRERLTDQVLQLVATVYRPRHREPARLLSEFAKLKVRFDADECKYTFEDGSYLDAQTSLDENPATLHEQVDRLIQAVASGEALQNGGSEHVPILIEIVERGEHQEFDLAIRVLTALQSQAHAAIAVLCIKLNDRRHATRSLAVDALVAIGDNSVAPLRDLIRSPSGRTRAAATVALSRLQRIDLSDLNKLAKDPDPRVRAAVATALSHVGKPGVPQLASFLLDPEVAVAIVAAISLQSNQEDPSIAVPKLIEAVSRPILCSAAAEALATYGVKAQRAVPAIIQDFPVAHPDRFYWYVEPERMLEHIGPPDERDIPTLCECLNHPDEEARILAAKSLARMGVTARAAALALEAATEATIEQSLEQQRKYGLISLDAWDNSGRVFREADYSAAAVWHVTHDADRFTNFVEKIVLAADCPIKFYRPSPWQEFSADECQLLKPFLQSPNLNLKYTALDAVSVMGSHAQSLTAVILELADGQHAELSRQAIGALAKLGPSVAKKLEPVLLSKLQDGTITLRTFAETLGGLETCSERSQLILERGLQDSDEWTVNACARSLSSTTNQPKRIAALFIGMARKGRLEPGTAIEVVQPLIPANGIVIPYLVEQCSSEDSWTRQEAINAVGSFGPAATSTIPLLAKQLDDDSVAIRLAAAKSILQISGDASYLESQLQSVFVGQDRSDRFEAIKTITEIGRAGAPFLHFVVTMLRAPERFCDRQLVDALKAIGTAEAIAELRKTTESTDWVLRSRATEALTVR